MAKPTFYYGALRLVGKSAQRLTRSAISMRAVWGLQKRISEAAPFLSDVSRSITYDYFYALADAFIVSYPKCGRTWLRLMIGCVLNAHYELGDEDPFDTEELATRHPHVVRVKSTHDRRPHRKRPDEIDEDRPTSLFGSKKIIFLVRDPRDVMVSSYFHATKRDRYFDGTMSEFIRHERYGVHSLIRFMNVWIANRNVPKDFLLVRYEDLKADPEEQLRAVVSFLGLTHVSASTISDAVGYARFENMQEMERSGDVGDGRLRPGIEGDEESFKVRRGVVGGYADYLNDDDVAYLTRAIRTELDAEFNYHNEPALDPAARGAAAL